MFFLPLRRPRGSSPAFLSRAPGSWLGRGCRAPAPGPPEAPSWPRVLRGPSGSEQTAPDPPHLPRRGPEDVGGSSDEAGFDRPEAGRTPGGGALRSPQTRTHLPEGAVLLQGQQLHLNVLRQDHDGRLFPLGPTNLKILQIRPQTFLPNSPDLITTSWAPSESGAVIGCHLTPPPPPSPAVIGSSCFSTVIGRQVCEAVLIGRNLKNLCFCCFLLINLSVEREILQYLIVSDCFHGFCEELKQSEDRLL